MAGELDPVDALVIVDVQNAFVTGQGAVPAAAELITTLTEWLRRAREAEAVVVHLQNDGPSGAVDEPDQAGWQLRLPVDESDREFVIRKTKDDGFDGTSLSDVLDRHQVRRIGIGGVMSEMCVFATARTALTRGLGVVLPHDAHATYDIPPAPGTTTGVAAAEASRVAEWALGDEVEIVGQANEVRFAEVRPRSSRRSVP